MKDDKKRIEAMNLGELKFKGEDFFKVYGPGQGGPKADLYLDFTIPGTEIAAHVLANHVNQLLRERLEKAPQVYGLFDCLMPQDSPECGSRKLGDTHTARLVCVEEIKK